MKPSIAVPALLGAALWVGCSRNSPSTASTSTGKEPPKNLHGPMRVAVKHGLDPEAASIDLTPKDTTIDSILTEKAPKDLAGGSYESKRIGPFEKSVWRVKANVKSVILRKDGDYYMVLESPSGKQSVVEVPDPKLCQGSPLQGRIQAARDDIAKRFHPTTDPKEINQEATIEGVGFFGGRGPSGKGPASGARLMPGLGLKWKS